MLTVSLVNQSFKHVAYRSYEGDFEIPLACRGYSLTLQITNGKLIRRIPLKDLHSPLKWDRVTIGMLDLIIEETSIIFSQVTTHDQTTISHAPYR